MHSGWNRRSVWPALKKLKCKQKTQHRQNSHRRFNIIFILWNLSRWTACISLTRIRCDSYGNVSLLTIMKDICPLYPVPLDFILINYLSSVIWFVTIFLSRPKVNHHMATNTRSVVVLYANSQQYDIRLYWNNKTRTHALAEIAHFRMRSLDGTGKHEAKSWMLSGPNQAPRSEMCNFGTDMTLGFLRPTSMFNK